MKLVNAWEFLLMYIRERRVVPVVGPELLVGKDTSGAPAPLYRLVAEQLADQLEVDPSKLSAERSLYDLAAAYLQGGNDPEMFYVGLYKLFNGLSNNIPEPLMNLAKITDFRLFLTTTCDGMLEKALRIARPNTPIVSLVYGPSDVQDLPADINLSTQTVVYHLLGRSSPVPDFVITEEDLLEFLYAMQDTTRRPKRLFDELKKHHLIMMGTGFSNWLARFFIRMTKGDRLSSARRKKEFVVDNSVDGDKDLVLFLRRFSRETEILGESDPADFANELYRRYAESATAPAEPQAAAPTDQMVPNSVFISYASQDRPFADALAKALAAANVAVWFDRSELKGGDAYDLKIRRNIESCSLFIPLISASTVDRDKGYFRQEWKWADNCADQVAEGVPFIIPTALDDTPADESSKVPARFLKIHWERLPGGQVTPEFVANINRLYRSRIRKERALA